MGLRIKRVCGKISVFVVGKRSWWLRLGWWLGGERNRPGCCISGAGWWWYWWMPLRLLAWGTGKRNWKGNRTDGRYRRRCNTWIRIWTYCIWGAFRKLKKVCRYMSRSQKRQLGQRYTWHHLVWVIEVLERTRSSENAWPQIVSWDTGETELSHSQSCPCLSLSILCQSVMGAHRLSSEIRTRIRDTTYSVARSRQLSQNGTLTPHLPPTTPQFVPCGTNRCQYALYFIRRWSQNT